MPLSATTWSVMIGSIVALWGVSTAVLYRTLRLEDRKLSLIEEQGRIDTYSPSALGELRSWIESNPDHEYVHEAKRRYNECVETLREIDEPFYDWDERQIDDLETFDT